MIKKKAREREGVTNEEYLRACKEGDYFNWFTQKAVKEYCDKNNQWNPCVLWADKPLIDDKIPVLNVDRDSIYCLPNEVRNIEIKIAGIHDARLLKKLITSGMVKGCAYCGSEFMDDDFAYALETGECQCCHNYLSEVTLQTLALFD